MSLSVSADTVGTVAMAARTRCSMVKAWLYASIRSAPRNSVRANSTKSEWARGCCSRT